METPQKDQTNAEVSKPLANINIDINADPDDSGLTTKNSTTIGAMDTSNADRVGLSKDELMKYANQPFWVRLRNILFASFWIIWVSILVGAIAYVVHSPGCHNGVSATPLGSTTTAASTSTS